MLDKVKSTLLKRGPGGIVGLGKQFAVSLIVLDLSKIIAAVR